MVGVLAEREGMRVSLKVEVLRREGSCGSMAIEPSFWRSRIFKSSRLICRSSCKFEVSIEEKCVTKEG